MKERQELKDRRTEGHPTRESKTIRAIKTTEEYSSGSIAKVRSTTKCINVLEDEGGTGSSNGSNTVSLLLLHR